jgi:hypothetical protein
MCVFFYQRENPLLMHVSTQSNKKKNLVSSGRQQLRAHFASAYMNSGKKKSSGAERLARTTATHHHYKRKVVFIYSPLERERGLLRC